MDRTAPCQPIRCFWMCGSMPQREFDVPVTGGHQAFVYLYEGEARIGDKTVPHSCRRHSR